MALQQQKELFVQSHRSSFFSSASAVNNSTTAKFPIPHYKGDSQPVPKINLPKQHQQIDTANALRPSFESQTPLLLQNLLGNCDAIYFWRSLEYWRVAVGEDTPVEIEVGKSYNSGSRLPMEFGDYLNYLAMSVEQEGKEYEEYQKQQKQQGDDDVEKQQIEQEVAYLAQNELFPAVLNDIPIPHFCENGEYKVGEGKMYHSMLWMGPRHTVSPLHFDPLDNLLMQVVGWKRVLLFPPDNQLSDDEGVKKDEQNNGHDPNEPSWHYAGTNGNQYNTSAVDIENPDHDRCPNFKASAPTPYECILGPGDGLYIPKKWWHHVRSLEMSVSANVWWR